MMQNKKRKQYSAEFKAAVVKELLKEEKTIGQLAAQYEVHANMLYKWRDQALVGLPSLFNDKPAQEMAEKEAAWLKEREALYAEIGRLTTNLSWLGKKPSGQKSRLSKNDILKGEGCVAGTSSRRAYEKGKEFPYSE